MNAQVNLTFSSIGPRCLWRTVSPAMVSELHCPPISCPIFFLSHASESWGYRRSRGPVSIILGRDAAEGSLDAMMILAFLLLSLNVFIYKTTLGSWRYSFHKQGKIQYSMWHSCLVCTFTVQKTVFGTAALA